MKTERSRLTGQIGKEYLLILSEWLQSRASRSRNHGEGPPLSSCLRVGRLNRRPIVKVQGFGSHVWMKICSDSSSSYGLFICRACSTSKRPSVMLTVVRASSMVCSFPLKVPENLALPSSDMSIVVTSTTPFSIPSMLE